MCLNRTESDMQHETAFGVESPKCVYRRKVMLSSPECHLGDLRPRCPSSKVNKAANTQYIHDNKQNKQHLTKGT
eukprot:3082892-Heterocapsa_arctica.AAC.1